MFFRLQDVISRDLSLSDQPTRTHLRQIAGLDGEELLVPGDGLEELERDDVVRVGDDVGRHQLAHHRLQHRHLHLARPQPGSVSQKSQAGK